MGAYEHVIQLWVELAVCGDPEKDAEIAENILRELRLHLPRVDAYIVHRSPGGTFYEPVQIHDHLTGEVIE